jgi:hypothetical protein
MHLIKWLRVVLIIDAVIFFAAALQNMGVQIPLGFTTLAFSDPIWQAGAGEAVIGLALLLAAFRHSSRLSWIAFGMSVLGIVFGLRSVRVVGAARDIHVVLVPLAVILFGILVWQRAQGRAPKAKGTAPKTGGIGR